MDAAIFNPSLTRPADPEPSCFVTEDNAPVDNPFSERQMKLLTRSLEASWTPPPDGRFVAMANVGLFDSIQRGRLAVLGLLRLPQRPPVVPDVLVSLGVKELEGERGRAYFVWEYGKPPDIVVEIVSNRKGGEADRKLAAYARIGVRYYAIFDPEHHIQQADLRTFELGDEGHYRPLAQPFFARAGLGLTLWEGPFAGRTKRWLRWTDQAGNLIPTGEESRQALLVKLRAKGINPDTL